MLGIVPVITSEAPSSSYFEVRIPSAEPGMGELDGVGSGEHMSRMADQLGAEGFQLEHSIQGDRKSWY